ncbi:MAG TPA: dethiobiotin synthase [Acidiphilium sp.]|jgi:dethiobiotin synthetase|uniref:dethiobiotin synthase n=1 Tax=unclassified Acidiphilium TaxID=2617493 RepID=UPI000BC69A0E|nr:MULTISPECIES: dethiobiotin synthase [unclassified Acidiphilium]OYV57736.1 MAG: dethiobiotin synthase [Acidiphilium sp. 20-67-58]OYV87494.1 MAG: dethiobiotin synthase [Acidiphilium sp. 21-68-69]HQT60040.1 dethiobiotin synthase [Acidiphilium sp.]HQU10707.1 dethiobiotin synthase [Acidiphilium sp.]
MSDFFITASGTEIGKTHVAAGMIRHWRAGGVPARALKPVASGYDPVLAAESDAGILLRAMGKAVVTDDDVAAICPWRFPDPISPDMAAARCGRRIPFDELVAFCKAALAEAEAPLLVEGVGGAMVPLDETHTVRDWIAALGLEVVLVAGGYLGAISHTLCTVEALRARAIPIAAIVINPMDPLPVPVGQTRETLLRHLGKGAPPVLVGSTPDWLAWVNDAARR